MAVIQHFLLGIILMCMNYVFAVMIIGSFYGQDAVAQMYQAVAITGFCGCLFTINIASVYLCSASRTIKITYTYFVKYKRVTVIVALVTGLILSYLLLDLHFHYLIWNLTAGIGLFQPINLTTSLLCFAIWFWYFSLTYTQVKINWYVLVYRNEVWMEYLTSYSIVTALLWVLVLSFHLSVVWFYASFSISTWISFFLLEYYQTYIKGTSVDSVVHLDNPKYQKNHAIVQKHLNAKQQSLLVQAQTDSEIQQSLDNYHEDSWLIFLTSFVVYFRSILFRMTNFIMIFFGVAIVAFVSIGQTQTLGSIFFVECEDTFVALALPVMVYFCYLHWNQRNPLSDTLRQADFYHRAALFTFGTVFMLSSFLYPMFVYYALGPIFRGLQIASIFLLVLMMFQQSCSLASDSVRSFILCFYRNRREFVIYAFGILCITSASLLTVFLIISHSQLTQQLMNPTDMSKNFLGSFLSASFPSFVQQQQAYQFLVLMYFASVSFLCCSIFQFIEYLWGLVFLRVWLQVDLFNRRLLGFFAVMFVSFVCVTSTWINYAALPSLFTDQSHAIPILYRTIELRPELLLLRALAVVVTIILYWYITMNQVERSVYRTYLWKSFGYPVRLIKGVLFGYDLGYEQNEYEPHDLTSEEVQPGVRSENLT